MCHAGHGVAGLHISTVWEGSIDAQVCCAACLPVDSSAALQQVRPGLQREQRSVVHIKKCRYLESSGCVGMCINMCKVSSLELEVYVYMFAVSVGTHLAPGELPFCSLQHTQQWGVFLGLLYSAHMCVSFPVHAT